MKRFIAFLLTITTALPILSSCAPTTTVLEDTEGTEYIIPDVTISPDDTTDDDFDPYHDEYGFVIFAPGDYLMDRKFDTDEYLPEYDANNLAVAHGDPYNGGICSTDDMIYYFCEVVMEPEYSGGPQQSYSDAPQKYLLLMYRDKETGEGGVLCQNAGCEHRDNSCSSFFLISASDIHGMFRYDGKIYWSTNTNINRMDPDIGVIEKVASVSKGMFPEYDLCSTAAAVPHRGYVYYAGKHSALVHNEMKYTLRIGAEPTDGGEDGFTILEREVSGNASYILRFIGNDVYIMILDYASVTGDRRNIKEEKTIELYRWDSKTRKAELLFQAPEAWDEDGERVRLDAENGFVIQNGEVYVYLSKGSYASGDYHYGIGKLSAEAGRIEIVSMLEKLAIIPCWESDRIYAHVKGNVFIYDFNGNLIEETGRNIWGTSFVGADNDYMYYTAPDGNYGYIAIPFDNGETITLDSGE